MGRLMSDEEYRLCLPRWSTRCDRVSASRRQGVVPKRCRPGSYSGLCCDNRPVAPSLQNLAEEADRSQVMRIIDPNWPVAIRLFIAALMLP